MNGMNGGSQFGTFSGCECEAWDGTETELAEERRIPPCPRIRIAGGELCRVTELGHLNHNAHANQSSTPHLATISTARPQRESEVRPPYIIS